MPSVPATTLIQRARRFVGDYPETDVTTASAASNGSAITVASDATTRYFSGQIIQIGTEALRVSAVASTTSLTVQRARWGSTAASVASGATIMASPRYLDVEYFDAINAGIDATWPYLYKPIVDETLTGTANTFEYDVPAMPSDSTVYPHVSEVWELMPGDSTYGLVRNWRLRTGTAGLPVIRFRHEPTAGSTLRIRGFGPFPRLTSFSDTTDATFPRQAENALVEFMAGWLLESGETRRTAIDRGVIDNREQANRVGASMSMSNFLLTRFQRKIENLQGPMPGFPNVVTAVP